MKTWKRKKYIYRLRYREKVVQVYKNVWIARIFNVFRHFLSKKKHCCEMDSKMNENEFSS